ncbi:MAG: prepilin-type N-terminal cleavage/methylation domain-containing protein [Akkermansiaceae bacterium]|jgi:prepilin-type N-terminal cleavage/methylation domain-containing protein
MKTNKWTRKGFTLVELLVVIAIIVALAALATPAILRQRKKMDMTQAISNSKQIYLVLQDFEQDFGNFPDTNTATQSQDLQQFSGNFANQLLGQLIAGGYTRSEEIFFAKGGNPAGNKKPDDVINPVASILQQGECGFAYVLVTGGSSSSGTARGLSTSDNGGIPILCAPVKTGGNDAVFNADPYDNRGVYLRVDGSARSERLNSNDNRVRLGGGNTLFGAGVGTVWGQGASALQPNVLLPQ